MLVKIVRRSAGYGAGEIVDMEPMSALELIEAGAAEVYEEKAIYAAPENKMLNRRSIK